VNAPLCGVALRLHGPMQAWGGPVIGDSRPTLPFPTRSGVLGLVAACMGILRSENDRLLALAEGTRVHVRVDASGTPLVDDQTIQDNPNASITRQTIQSKRTYLCDASFAAVVVPGPHTSVQAIASAVQSPVFAPCLGRRTCVLSTPLLIAAEVTGSDPIALFDSIERGPKQLLELLDPRPWSERSSEREDDEDEHDGGLRRPDHVDFYLDVADYPGALRRIPIRDHFAGPLPRQWRERHAVHVRTRPQPTPA
jgi:CRISPR system Cascade subunit CasD